MPRLWRRRWFRALVFGLGGLLLLLAVFVVLVVRAMGERLEHPPLVAELVEAPGATVLFRDVAVFPGRTRDRLLHHDVLIRDGRVVALGPTGTLALPQTDFEVIDGSGRTLLPGLVNAHVHVMAPGGVPWRPIAPSPEHNLEAWLVAGVTTVYDLGGPASMLADYAAQTESLALPGPRIVHGSVPMTAPGGHPLPAGEELAAWPLSMFLSFATTTVETDAEAREAVADVADQGLPFVKIIRDTLPVGTPRLGADRVATIVDEAHQRGLKAFVHIGDLDDLDAALAARADVLAHMVYRGEIDQARAHQVAAAGVAMIATLHGFQATVDLVEGTLEPSALARTLHAPEILDPVTGEEGTAFMNYPTLAGFGTTLQQERPRWASNLRRLHEAGVPILVGTDAPLPGVFPGSAYHEELRALHEAGIPLPDLLHGATWAAASAMFERPSFGAIEPGMEADLVLVRGDPTQELAAISAIEGVWRQGRRVTRS